MKYLILGSSSFYGRNFLEFLKEKGENVEGLQRPSFDLRKDFRLPSADVVVNFISEGLVEESWEDPERWLETNVICTNRLFEQLRSRDLTYIHIGTPEVYGNTPTWVSERHRFNPSTPYAVSRACADMMLKAYFKAYRFPMMITRTANIYGPGQQEFRLIPKAFSLDRFPIHGSGNTHRSYIHVKDACAGLYTVCKSGTLGETYHISTQKTHSVLSVVRMIHKIKGFGEVEFKNERLGKDLNYKLNSDKLRKLGWFDHFTLEEGLKSCKSSL